MKVLTIGTFDLFHEGHRRLIERAAEFGELTVGVNSDRFVEQYKHRPPVIPFDRRFAIVCDLGVAKAVCLNDGHGAELIIKERPDMLVIGSDWHESGYLRQIGMAQAEIDGLDISILYLPRTPNISTTQLRG